MTTDIIHRIDLVKRQHNATTPLLAACKETLEAYQFFLPHVEDETTAAVLSGIALDNILEDE